MYHLHAHGRKKYMHVKIEWQKMHSTFNAGSAALNIWNTPFPSLHLILYASGIYACSKCGYEIFSSSSKYKHTSPWPAFTETIHEDSVSKHLEKRGAYKVQSEETKTPISLLEAENKNKWLVLFME